MPHKSTVCLQISDESVSKLQCQTIDSCGQQAKKKKIIISSLHVECIGVWRWSFHILIVMFCLGTIQLVHLMSLLYIGKAEHDVLHLTAPSGNTSSIFRLLAMLMDYFLLCFSSPKKPGVGNEKIFFFFFYPKLTYFIMPNKTWGLHTIAECLLMNIDLY